jgi:phasin family protein
MASAKTANSSKTDLSDFAKRAFAPAQRFNELFVGNFERLARFQYELGGEVLQLALDQMNATVKAKDLPTLIAKQREITTKFAEKATQRQQALAEIASESQASLAKWIEDASALVSPKAA